jgi:hypothetical protein
MILLTLLGGFGPLPVVPIFSVTHTSSLVELVK